MAKALIDQCFCHYEHLEEYKFGMWRKCPSGEFPEAVSRARSYMMNVGQFSDGMADVCEEWGNSCKVNFTDPSINPISWLGQAAVCCILGYPESVTRAAWVDLPHNVQHRANACAKMHIDNWRKVYIGQGELFNEF